MGIDAKEAERIQAALEGDLQRAQKLVNDLERYAYWRPDEPDEEEDLIELQLADVLLRIELRLIAAFERLGLRMVAERLAARASRHKKATSFQMLPWIGELWNPLLGDLTEFHEILKPYLPEAEADSHVERDRERLRGILAGTPKMLSDRGVVPSAESDVEEEVYKTLIHLFPDTVRQIPIPKAVKTYKPDLGVRSLGTAIEYKFADSETEFKACLDGIFTDIHAYADTKDWRHFFAVLYVTDQFFTQAQLDAHLRSSNIPDTWTFIMVSGRGGRRAGEKGGKGQQRSLAVKRPSAGTRQA